MKRSCQVALTVALVAMATVRVVAGDAPPGSARPELDPQHVFQAACDRLKDLDGAHAVLDGVSKVKPYLQLDDKKRLKSARFVFEHNAVPPGKNPAKAKDAAKPFVHVTVQVWSGDSQQPPAGLQAFQWKREEYVAWVQVHGSDPALVKAVHKAVAEPMLAPIPRK